VTAVKADTRPIVPQQILKERWDLLLLSNLVDRMDALLELLGAPDATDRVTAIQDQTAAPTANPLVDAIGRLVQALERQADSRPWVVRMAYQKKEVAAAMNLSEKTIERLLSRGQFPKPAARANSVQLWRHEELVAWLNRGGAAEE
jgi:predicted DNA-binding transcriptional regulator AlpA